MRKNENIYVDLRLKRNQVSGKINLNTYFDKNAPNFFTYKNVISWSPTIEELGFVNEAFEMLSTRSKSKKDKENLNENIYVDLQVERDQNSGELMLNIHFDKNAPNFSSDENDTSWSPTSEELDFVNEAIKIFSKGKNSHHEELVDDHCQKQPETKETVLTISDSYMEEDDSIHIREEGDAVVDKLIKRRKKQD